MLGHLYYFNKNCFTISLNLLPMRNIIFDVYKCLISLLFDRLFEAELEY